MDYSIALVETKRGPGVAISRVLSIGWVTPPHVVFIHLDNGLLNCSRRNEATYPGVLGGQPNTALGLAPVGVCLASTVTSTAGEPLPHPFNFTEDFFKSTRLSE